MLLPNKLFSYNESTLPLLPKILAILDKPTKPTEIVAQLQNGEDVKPTRIIEALDCLYALGKIKLTEEGLIEKC